MRQEIRSDLEAERCARSEEERRRERKRKAKEKILWQIVLRDRKRAVKISVKKRQRAREKKDWVNGEQRTEGRG